MDTLRKLSPNLLKSETSRIIIPQQYFRRFEKIRHEVLRIDEYLKSELCSSMNIIVQSSLSEFFEEHSLIIKW